MRKAESEAQEENLLGNKGPKAKVDWKACWQ